jgi:hypothetical protein
MDFRGAFDLTNNLPPLLQPLALMIYIGFENNSTPGHKDIVGSLGHNIMSYADEGAYALWFCFASKDIDVVRKFWRSKGGSIDSDDFLMPFDDLCEIPCNIYVIKQMEGDLVLVPPEVAHQVINKVVFRIFKIYFNRKFFRTEGALRFRGIQLRLNLLSFLLNR